MQQFRSLVQQIPRSVLWRKEFALIGLACASILFVTAGRVAENREISRSRQRVAKAVLASQSVDNLTMLVMGVETAQRGFLLTGSPQYLEPYVANRRELPAAISQFRRTSRNVPLNEQEVNELVERIEDKLDEMEKVIELNRRYGSAPAIALVKTNLGKLLMDRILQISRVLKLDCTNLFTRESEQLKQENRRALRIAVAGGFLVFGVLVLTAIRLYWYLRRQSDLLEQVREAAERYRLLARRVESVKEDERADLARDIHDALGQTLTVIKMDLAITASKLSAEDIGAANAKLEQASTSIDAAIRALRRFASELRPPLLDTAGLQAALEAYAKEMEGRTGLKIRFSFEEMPSVLNAQQRITAFRICQESLTNIIRHARASEVAIALVSKSESIQLTVADDGIGFSTDEVAGKRSLGLLGMQERAKLVGGELTVESEPGRGTVVLFRMPILMGELTT